MKFKITITVAAESEDDALGELIDKMNSANEEFQISDNNPPDMEWAKKVGLKISRSRKTR